MILEKAWYESEPEVQVPPIGELVKELGHIFKDALLERIRDKGEVVSQPLPLEELSQELGFEQNLTLQGIEYFILHTERTEEEIILLFGYYTDNAYIMLDQQETRNDRDSVALALKLADIRHKKGTLMHYRRDFDNIRNLIEYSSDIDRKTYDLVNATIDMMDQELAEQRKALGLD